jgi:hypothetical protein
MVPECKESILGARTMPGTPQLSQLNCDTIFRLHHVSPINDETRVQPFMRVFEPVDFWLEIFQNSLCHPAFYSFISTRLVNPTAYYFWMKAFS